MHKPLRASLIALLLGVLVIAAAPRGGSAQLPPGESPFSFGVEFKRPEVSLERALRRAQLVVPYSCMNACRPLMRLKVVGIRIAVFDPPGGPTAGSRAAVFKLGSAAQRAIVAHTHRGVASFRLVATFTNKSLDSLTTALRFRLRR